MGGGRLRTLKIVGKIINKSSKKWNFFLLPISIPYIIVNINRIRYSHCSQDLGNNLSIISEEIYTLDKIIKHSLQCITRDTPKECVLQTSNTTSDVSYAEYVYTGVRTNDDLLVTMANKGTETDSKCHQLIGTLRKTISLLKDKRRDKKPLIT